MCSDSSVCDQFSIFILRSLFFFHNILDADNNYLQKFGALFLSLSSFPLTPPLIFLIFTFHLFLFIVLTNFCSSEKDLNQQPTASEKKNTKKRNKFLLHWAGFTPPSEEQKFVVFRCFTHSKLLKITLKCPPPPPTERRIMWRFLQLFMPF